MAKVHLIAAARDFTPVLIHAGQHYDATVSDVLFDELPVFKIPDCRTSVRYVEDHHHWGRA